jgi:hypothetical protein
MTDETVALLELIEKGANADLVRELLAFASERLMAAEVGQLTGACARGLKPGPAQLSQRLSRAWLGDARRPGRRVPCNVGGNR